MPGITLPVSRPIGRAMVVANATVRPAIALTLHALDYESAEVDDPYTAMAQLARGGAQFTAVIVSLASIYKEELPFIATVKRRFPRIEVWLAHTDGRTATLAEAMRLGADGLLADDGLHRVATAAPAPAAPARPAPSLLAAASQVDDAESPWRDAEAATDRAPIESGSQDSRQADDLDAEELEALSNASEPVLTAEELRALLQDSPVAATTSAPAPSAPQRSSWPENLAARRPGEGGRG